MKKKLKSLMTPFEKFFAWASASGLVLLACAVLALLLANSPLADAYAHLLHLPLLLRKPRRLNPLLRRRLPNPLRNRSR